MAKRTLRKVVDDYTQVRCAAGPGVIREEVWTDENNRIAKYNLAFINLHLFREDNGRVLGYDNAHGHAERHHKGTIKPYNFTSYEALLATFLDEIEILRREKP